MYIGEWRNDKKEGLGLMLYVDGSFIEGQFKNGFVHGKGTNFESDGLIYSCNWKSGKIQRLGILYYSNNEFYKGKFENCFPKNEN